MQGEITAFAYETTPSFDLVRWHHRFHDWRSRSVARARTGCNSAASVCCLRVNSAPQSDEGDIPPQPLHRPELAAGSVNQEVCMAEDTEGSAREGFCSQGLVWTSVPGIGFWLSCKGYLHGKCHHRCYVDSLRRSRMGDFLGGDPGPLTNRLQRMALRTNATP
jgi:hypothetical protein